MKCAEWTCMRPATYWYEWYDHHGDDCRLPRGAVIRVEVCAKHLEPVAEAAFADHNQCMGRGDHLVSR